MAREITTVGVVGIGTMGAGITEVFARNGFFVVGVEQDQAALHRGRGHVETSTGRAVRRGKMSAAEQSQLLERITFTTDMDVLAACQLVVEAVPEHRDLKRDVFARLDKIVTPDAILATNTSSLSVTEISVATELPRRVVGMHFFNPAPVQEFVEVVRTVVTDDDVVEDVTAIARRLGKAPVECRDRAGFIANALLFGYLNHAASMYETRYASREDIDDAMRVGCGYPMGPLALLDLIGLDTAYEILETMYRQGRDRLHAPTPILKQLVTAGFRGRKSGRGFYTYDKPDSPVVVADTATPTGAPPAGVREVRSVGVVGSSDPAARIVENLVQARFDVTTVDVVTPAVTGADLVVEAVADELSAKREVFTALDAVCKPGAILATTSSLVPVIACAASTSRAANVVGTHMVAGVAVDRDLVEVVRTVSTADDVVATVRSVCRRAGMHPVTCGDRAGFIVNALLFPYLNDAVKMLEAQYATADDIDTAMRLGCRLPTGPFQVLDDVGLDTALAIQRMLYAEFPEPGYAPAPLLENLVTAGFLGRKTGRGFRDHA
ncbi:MAG: 3-hydroxyacyl-CoA dehydrogenase family protein [Jiangellaceae bacterium]|nr:3-hydroxyacyl-CoA dehydrogenase family protein [Jiangellaceae bacterium]